MSESWCWRQRIPFWLHLSFWFSGFISKLLSQTAEEELTVDENVKEETKASLVNRMMNVITLVKKAEEEAATEERVKSPEEIFRQVLITTIVRWAQETVTCFISISSIHWSINYEQLIWIRIFNEILSFKKNILRVILI